jgi:hypothetical protein
VLFNGVKRGLFIRIALAVFIALLAAIVLPNFIGAKALHAQCACINNLHWLDRAKQQWQDEHYKSTNDTPTFEELAPYLGRTNAPLAYPEGGTYLI